MPTTNSHSIRRFFHTKMGARAPIFRVTVGFGKLYNGARRAFGERLDLTSFTATADKTGFGFRIHTDGLTERLELRF